VSLTIAARLQGCQDPGHGSPIIRDFFKVAAGGLAVRLTVSRLLSCVSVVLHSSVGSK